MNKRTHTTRSSLGITLIEMMVALAITSFVMLVVNQLFNSVTATVARGTQASELLQKSREIDRQLAFETDLDNSTYDPATLPTSSGYAQWRSRMVGPAGRDGTGPGGFLAIVQRTVQAPLTIEDSIQGLNRTIRSDQLMFIYDQDSPLDGGDQRLHAMAPASEYSYTGDQRDSINADYTRIWYGHVLQLRPDQDPLSINIALPAQYADIELGNTAGAGNPNALAQDWVLGRHALFLTDSSVNPFPQPYGPHLPKSGSYVNALAGISSGPSGGPRLAHGLCDVADYTLEQITDMGNGLDNPSISLANYQNNVLASMFTGAPLLTAAKPADTPKMRAWDYSPTHTYFMGGVSDFIVEFAGDLVTGHQSAAPTVASLVPDGELDRDGDGRIKWYTAVNANWGPVYNPDQPVTYPTPIPTYYPPRDATVPGRANAAFVWQHEPDPANAALVASFRQWPWMLRIRYRLHDRRGDFEGREVTNITTGDTELEPGIWYETIIPVNFQGL